MNVECQQVVVLLTFNVQQYSLDDQMHFQMPSIQLDIYSFKSVLYVSAALVVTATSIGLYFMRWSMAIS